VVRPLRLGKGLSEPAEAPFYDVVLWNSAAMRVDFLLCDVAQNCNMLYLDGQTYDSFGDCSGYCKIKITTQGKPSAEYDLKGGGKFEIGWSQERQRYEAWTLTK
jgi:hypothetical protein